MKRFLLIVFAGLLAPAIYSQNHYLDISGGLNISKVRSYAAADFKKGPGVGLGYEFRFAHIMSLKTGLMYNQRGGKYETYLYDSAAQQSYARHYPIKTHYVSLPVLLGLVSTGDTYGFGRFGAMLSYLLDANAEEPVRINGEYITETRNIKQRFKSMDVVGVIEGGMGSAVGSRIILEAAVALQVGLSNAVKQRWNSNSGFNPESNSIELPNNPHVGFSIMLAVKYRLGSKGEE